MRSTAPAPRSVRDVLGAARETAQRGLDVPAGILARTALARHARNLFLWHARIGRDAPVTAAATLAKLLQRRVIDWDTWKRLRSALRIGNRCSINEPVHFSEIFKLMEETQVFIDRYSIDEEKLEAILRSYDEGTGLFRDPDDDEGDAWKGGAV